MLGNDFENFVDVNTDTTIYSFDKIIDLLAKCNPNTIELLGLDTDDYIYKNEFGELLLKNKDIFYRIDVLIHLVNMHYNSYTVCSRRPTLL